MVGPAGFEPATSPLSGVRSNQLSYEPLTITPLFKREKEFAGDSAPQRTRHILRKEVIQPQVPLRLPCYDLVPVADPTVARCLQKVSTRSSGEANSHDLTGSVYKTRERIHRTMLMRDY